MRRAGALLTAVALAACEAPAPTPDGDLRMRQEAACRAAIATHVGRPEAEVTARWLSEGDGIAQVETVDGTRRHVCTVDAAARVTGYIHPGA